MERQKPELPNDDSTRTTVQYNTRSSTRKGFSNTDGVDDESTSLRVMKKRKKVADERSTNSDLHLPIDLIVEILKRLPAKTLARFLCVSKVWSSTIRSRDFRKLFTYESLKRPGRLFFTFSCPPDRFLFSLNQIPNPGESTYHMAHPVSETTIKHSSCVHDLICYVNNSRSELVVYNSTTKRSITLPALEPPGSLVLKSFMCYDPIDAVYKVLCLCYKARILTNSKVLTLGNGNEWRIVKETHTHLPSITQICINGVLYYDAYVNWKLVVMSFDVRSEKFHLIKGPGGVDFPPRGQLTMTRYEGKLAIISREISANGSLVLWILEDSTKHEWLKKVFVLSLTNPCIPSPHEFHSFLNITVEGEFVLAPVETSVTPFYVLYYDPKRKSMRKVSIKGITDHELYRLNREEPWYLGHIFTSEVESLVFW